MNKTFKVLNEEASPAGQKHQPLGAVALSLRSWAAMALLLSVVMLPSGQRIDSCLNPWQGPFQTLDTFGLTTQLCL